MNNYDVIVVGAGPAGSTAARICAEKGLNVLIIEKEDFPREKPCGGGLSMGAVKELDIILPESLIVEKCYGMRSVFNGRQSQIFDSQPVAYMINRIEFDDFLLKKAIESGAVFQKKRCLNVVEKNDGVIIKTDIDEIFAGYCIGADGYFSKTARAVRDKFSEDEIRFCLITSIIGNNHHPIYDREKPSVELDFGYISLGYGWLFPKHTHISAGIGGALKDRKNLRNQFISFLKFHNLTPSNQLTGCFIPISRLKQPICTDRIMLTGDAAGLVDSFSGEGIKNAIISGKTAAETAYEVLNSNKKVTAALYRKKIYSQIAQDLIWSMRISKLSNRYENIVYGKLLFSEKIIKKYFTVMRGEKNYKRFFIETIISLPFLFS
ncbi:MAG: geranylgeranyl reductase family protein [Spirochaetaceae bacterium]|nr:geranylgeranyl reductase family protein [Spirochaetaceae bacterium]